jgi:hypothetical protein
MDIAHLQSLDGQDGRHTGDEVKAAKDRVSVRLSTLDVAWLVRAASLTLAAMCATLTVARAHEIGTTRVTARVTASEYTIDVVVDPVSLLSRLETLSGRSPSGPWPASEYPARIEALRQEFLSQVRIRFDEVAVTARLEYRALPASAADEQFGPGPATIRLTGHIPPGARLLTWTYNLTAASYAFTAARDAAAAAPIEWLHGQETSRPFPVGTDRVPASRSSIAWTYLLLGFTHIVPKGIDHILFVLGLFLFSRRLGPLLWQVTAFTVAHSITLALSMFGLVRVSSAVVEPLIALSIAYVAVENVFTSRLGPWRLALIGTFGLLHGLGFAGVLSELGLPPTDFVTALITFNLGVEAGQLTVIAIASVVVAHWADRGEWYRRRIVVPASAMIAVVGVYWTVQRLL